MSEPSEKDVNIGKGYSNNKRYSGSVQDDKQNPQQFRTPRQHKQVYVEDLREKLNRKRREQNEQPGAGPPPDPNYNFLKDPARDGETDKDEHKQRQHINTNFNGSARRGSHMNRPNRSEHNNESRQLDVRSQRYNERKENFEKRGTIQPLNIRVQLSTATGTRSCVLDEEKKLPEIKHVPDRHNDRRSYGQRYYYNQNPQHGRTARGRSNHQEPRGVPSKTNDSKEFRKKHQRHNNPDPKLDEEEPWDTPETYQSKQPKEQTKEHRETKEKFKQSNGKGEVKVRSEKNEEPEKGDNEHQQADLAQKGTERYSSEGNSSGLKEHGFGQTEAEALDSREICDLDLQLKESIIIEPSTSSAKA